MRIAPLFLKQSILVLVWYSLAQAYSTGPDPRYTGAPGDAPGACTSCHLGQRVNSGQGSVKILLANGSSYTPGVKQHIMVQVADPQQKRWGFQMTARLKSNLAESQAGDFTSTDGFTQVLCDNGNLKPCPANSPVQFIEHTAAGTRIGSASGVTFEFDWTPPASDAGNVVFYVAANAANGDGNLTGDHIYTANIELTVAGKSTPPPTPTTMVQATRYLQHNLVSDVPGLADQTDVNLVNPWGIALSASSPFWISNNRSGTSTLYNGLGQPLPAGNPVVVRIAATGNSSPSPAGQVFNGTPAFELMPGKPASFLIASEAGTISGLNSSVDAGNAKLLIDQSGSGAVYKGIALGGNASGPLLYVANFSAGTVDVFDGALQPAALSGNFSDPNLPAGFAPFNIQRIGRKLYVTYALQDGAKRNDVAGSGNGVINVFDMDGNFRQRLVSNGLLNSPWGIALEPREDFLQDARR